MWGKKFIVAAIWEFLLFLNFQSVKQSVFKDIYDLLNEGMLTFSKRMNLCKLFYNELEI